VLPPRAEPSPDTREPTFAGDRPVYLLGGSRLSPGSGGFEHALLAAHEMRMRPLCLCVAGGVEMYTSRTERACLLKRMPGTGASHAAGCPSFEPPNEWTGLGPLLGTAIRRDPINGSSVLRLGFSLSSRRREAAASVRAQEARATDATPNRRLSMLGLLHYLWDQAALNRWKPSFEGKRVWAVVRSRSLIAAADMRIHGETLASRLYIPEPFELATWDKVQERRRRRFDRIHGHRQDLVLAELKEIFPRRGTWHFVFKHLPDTPFVLPEGLLEQARRTFDRQFTLWSSSTDTRLVVLATFALNSAGAPEIAQMCVQVVDGCWLPIEDGPALRLIRRLASSRRAFLIPLNYGCARIAEKAPAALLTDSGPQSLPIYSRQQETPAAETGQQTKLGNEELRAEES
jgi:hypothetical protein